MDIGGPNHCSCLSILVNSVTLTFMNQVMQESLRGIIERITFHNEENGYTVAKLVPERATRHLPHWQKEVPIIGTMAGVNIGEAVELQGGWTVHPEYGKQFTVTKMRSILPATIAGIERYLGSGLIKGVGPGTAKRIVAHFGSETLDIIDTRPERLSEVPGVGKKRVSMIYTAWAEQRAIKEVMVFLQGHGVSTSLATKIYKRYRDDAIETVQQNPYRLATDIFGIGFLTSDKIAHALGIAEDAPQRIAAGVEYSLKKATDEGHVFLPSGELIRQAEALLHVGKEKVAAGVLQLKGADRVKLTAQPGAEAEALQWAVTEIHEPNSKRLTTVPPETRPDNSTLAPAQIQELLQEEQAVYLTPMYYGEVGVSNRLRRLLRDGQSRLESFRLTDWEQQFARLPTFHSLAAPQHSLAPQQRAALQSALTHRITVLTGGPGTGKTTVVRAIIELCAQAGYTVLLAAPTGRAAKRLSETTGWEAKTIHRLLEFQPAAGMSFKRNEENPLAGDLLIVDEASMLDLILMNHLLKAIPAGMSLVLVGDVDQLPSVGAGNVLEDVITAIEEISSAQAQMPPEAGIGGCQIVRLDTIFRQKEGSYIIENAHRINRGKMPILDNTHAEDFFFFRTDDTERAAHLCVELVQERIPRRFGIPPQDIQVLSPMHRGPAGVAALNAALQQSINPPRPDIPERTLGNRIFRSGDRIMQTRNNYDKEVYNGDMGYITTISAVEQQVTVAIGGRMVSYDFLELDELAHAYAISVHKSQGSEFPVVVIPVLTSHYMMLQRNLLYTAITRARKLVVLVGQTRAIGMAVHNDKVAQRYTGLAERLQRTA